MDAEIEPRQLIVPGLANFYRGLAPLAYPFMRFVIGIMLMPHGYMKLFHGATGGLAHELGHAGFPAPLAWAYFVGCVEFFGGACLALGLLTRIAAAAVAIEMAMTIILAHAPNGFFWTSKGYEYPLMWGLLSLAVLWRGGGRYSIDHVIGKEF